MKILEIDHPPAVQDLVRRFGCQSQPFILDSSLSNDGLGEWSFFGANPFQVIAEKGGGLGLTGLRERMAGFRRPGHELIPFLGGAVGFLSYDYGRQIERIPDMAVDDRDVPDLYFAFYDGIAALNHRTGKLHLIALGIRDHADVVLEELKEIVATEVDSIETSSVRGSWEWNVSHEDFLASVGRVKDYIAQGDVYQVNLSRRARCEYQGDPMQLYAALRLGNPAPYSAFIDTGDFQLFSTSPEQFVRKRGSEVVTRPIKGTRPRGRSAEEDLRNAEALRSSVKDRAELLMIVDLERNDLGRVAEYGSVEVQQLYHLEHYARVIHQTAQVKARLAADKDVFDCIEALFPGGSITGAPKVRAMQIIEELEPTRRGVYCGSVGYIGFDGNAEMNIAIRSLHLKAGMLDYQVGGGIVWDSEPQAEYQETLDKGSAIRETIDALCQKSSR